MFPGEVYEIVKVAVANNSDPDGATKEAEAKIRQLPRFQAMVAQMVTTAVGELVYRERAAINVKLRTQAGEYGKPAKVNVGANVAVQRAYQSYYSYYIGGSVLGSIRGSDLLEIAKQERGQAKGHEFNAILCERLKPLVPADKEVRQAVPEKKLKKLFEELKADMAA